MNTFRRTAALAAALVMLTACSQTAGTGSDTGNAGSGSADTSAADTSAAESEATPVIGEGALNVMYGDIRTEFNDSLDLSDYPLTGSDVPDGYSITVEAESGTFSGGGRADELPEASGGAYATGVNTEGDRLDIPVTVEYSGFYDVNIVSRGSGGNRVNNFLIDDMKVGDFTTLSEGLFGDAYIYNIHLTAGEHTLSITPSWGYIDMDCIVLEKTTHPVTEDTYKVDKPLSNPNADDHTKRLYKFLCDIYGKYSLTGQYADEGRLSKEYEKLTAKTGKTFAVLGLDVSGYSLGSKEHGTESRTIEYAYDWYNNAGGIVQLCWHWTSPGEYALNSEGHPWYSSFYKEDSRIDLDKIMNGEDETGYQLLMDDIDNMSNELGRLRDAGVPVLWRPLHEASGGWFWWGNCEAESYKKLWNVMYDKMTNEHGLTNLIWIWNGQSVDWYPGDETVDIVGWDIYAGNLVDSSQSGRFTDMAYNYGDATKLIALTENGCVMDPDKVFEDNARWLFWGTWSDPFTMKLGVVVNDEYTSFDTLIKAYNHDRTLTLDELPDLKNYE